ncbi:MAG: DNA recombination protein RmuC [Saprospiraceae bacterium]|nr:DNA recombination protein RmuC [Saprospiraceae bacterium]
MEDPLVLSFLFLLIGLVLGGAVGYFYSRSKRRSGLLDQDEIAAQYVRKEIHQSLQQQADIYREDLLEKEQEVRQFGIDLAAKGEKVNFLEEKLQTQWQEIQNLQKQSRLEFENIANRLLEEKSQKFTQHNQQQIDGILQPLKEKIKSFEEGIERRFLEETKDRISLQKEIEHLRLLNQQLSEDANNLATALKGENKTQGDWGEFQLELILEKAGLNKDIHYQVQSTFKDESGQQKRPDFIINLPEGKHLIIDSKVSLVAYERYFNTKDDKKRDKYLKQHIDSLRQHIKDLSSKNYQQLYQINTPDYLLLFVPIEPAFVVAAKADGKIFLDALDHNIVLVTSSTLLATMRTVAFIWKQEKQKKNVLEIARQSGLLYDKLCGFVQDLSTIGNRLSNAQSAYHDAMNKLVDSKKYGDTLIGRAEKIKALGAKASKQLPDHLLNQLDEASE